MPILVCCCLGQFLGVLDVSIVNVALGPIGEDLGFSTTGLQWVVNAYALACAGFLLLGGRAADLFGRREVFAVGAAVFGAASLAGGLAGDPATLVAARAAQGLGGAVMAPTSLSILARTYEAGAARNRAFAWWGTMGGLGGASGALLGGVLTEALSWRAILLVNAPVAVGLAVVSLRVIPRFGRRPAAARSFDLPGALAATAGLALLEYGIVAETFGPIAAGGALLALFGLIESRLAPAPLMPPRVLRSRGLSGAIAVALCLGGAAVPMWYLVSLYAQQSLGFSALQTGLTFLPMSLTIVACTQAAARLAARAGPGRVLAAGMTLLGAGMLTFSSTGDGSWAAAVLIPSLLCACGIGCSFVSTTISATSSVPTDDSGLATGLVNTAFQIGGSLGLAVLATIAATAGFERAFAAGGCVAIAGAAVAWLVIRRSPTTVVPRSRIGWPEVQ
jgi:MFS family permease